MRTPLCCASVCHCGKEGRRQGSKEARKQGSKEASKQARKEARKQGSQKARKQGKKDGRTRRQKQVPFHDRTHRTFLSIACVDTPHSDLRGKWEQFTIKRTWAKAALADAEKEKQEGIRAYYAGKSRNWEGFEEEHQKQCEMSEWASIKVKECYEKVASVDMGRLSTAQDMLCKSTDF